MPRNPFIPIDESQKINRNGVDLSERRLFTSDFGRIVPFYSREVLSGDSFEIDASVGLRSMPTFFPIQTRIRMSMEFYYCRNRCVWEDFEDFIFNTKKNIVQPWLKLDNVRAKKMISTGSLGDFFRVPTTYAVGSPISYPISIDLSSYGHYSSVNSPEFSNGVSVTSILQGDFSGNSSRYRYLGYLSQPINFPLHSSEFVSSLFTTSATSIPRNADIKLVFVNNNTALSYPISGTLSYEAVDGKVRLLYSFSESFLPFTTNLLKTIESYQLLILYSPSTGFSPYFPASYSLNSNHLVPPSLILDRIPSNVYDSTSDDFISLNPFVGDQPAIPLNALPFRHYEMLMNYYYRNDKNNPYVLNGVVEYNKFIPTKSSGADTNLYDFHYRNFELDQFTSAVQSPQFGEAPLVGLTYNRDGETATLRFQATNVESGQTSDYDVTVGLENDGRISSIVDFSKDVPSANLRKLQEDINAGISINSLRMGNSFQRFLENTYRGSLRYRNQLKSHRGVEVDYPDIDIPQYIGGASAYLDAGQVTSTAQTDSTGLGDFVGFISGGVSTQNKIRVYCPENGFIIGVVSFYPIPMYCQNLDKVMLKTSWLDYQQTEFDKIGFVPMHYSEVFPLQTPDGGSVNDVFGYQKAWYEYMRSYDSVHGDFRTSLRDFTLMRTFSSRPILSQSFTKVYPEQFNDIFAAKNIADDKGSSAKFMLSSNVQCIAQRQISVFGSPALE